MMKRAPNVKRCVQEWLAFDDARSDETRRKQEQALGYLLESCPKRSISSLSVADAKALAAKIKAKHTGRDLASTTVAVRVRHLKQFGQWCVDRGYLEKSPFAALRAGRGRINPNSKQFLDASQIQSILNWMTKNGVQTEWQLVLVLARWGGMRIPSELVELRWNDILWEEELIRVAKAKTAERKTPLFNQIREVLLQLRTELGDIGTESLVFQRWTIDKATNLRTQLERFIRRAGFKPWPRIFHNNRASICTELHNDKNVSIKEVANFMGNSPEVIMHHYEVERPETLKRIIHGDQPREAA